MGEEENGKKKVEKGKRTFKLVRYFACGKHLKRPVYIFAFGDYNSKQV